MKSQKPLLILILFLLGAMQAFSQTVLGSQIEYRGIDTFTFELELTVYIDCRDTTPLKIDSSNFFVEDEFGRVKFGLEPRLKSIRFNSSAHDSALTCDSSTGFPGVKQITYLDTLDIRPKKYDTLRGKNIRIYFATSHISPSTNLTCGLSGKRSGINFTQINSNDWQSHFSFTSKEEPMIYSMHAVIMKSFNASMNNGTDSVSYAIVEPKQSKTTNCRYTLGGGPWYPIIPFTSYCPSKTCSPYPNAYPPMGIYLDPEHGLLIYTAIDSNERANFVVEATKWRKNSTGKYEKMAIMRKELFHWMTDFKRNRYPLLKGPYYYSVCEGDSLCFVVNSDDKPFSAPGYPTSKRDTVKLTAEGAVPGLTTEIVNDTVLHQAMRVCFKPKIGMASTLPYDIVVNATDSFGPVQGLTSRVYSMIVKKRASGNVDLTQLNCGKHNYGYKIEASADSGFLGTFRASKLLLDSAGNVLFSSRKAMFTSSGTFYSAQTQDTLVLDTTGVFIVKTTLDNPPLRCPTIRYDTIHQRKNGGFFNSIDTIICDLKYDTLRVDSYWSTVMWQDSTTLHYLPITQPGLYTVKVEDSCSNAFILSFNVRSERSVKIEATDGQKLCDTIALLKAKVTGDVDSMRWTSGSDSSSTKVYNKGKYTLKVYGHCNIAVHDILVHDTLPRHGLPDSVFVCLLQPDTLRHELDDSWSVKWWNLRDTSYDRNFEINPAGGTHHFRAENECGDVLSHTVKLIHLKKPYLAFDTSYNVCENDSLVLNLLAGPFDHVRWSDADTASRRSFKSARSIVVKFSNLCGVDSASIGIRFTALPTIDVVGQSVHCQGDTAVLTAKGNQSENWRWSTGETADTINVRQPGIVTITNKNLCGEARDSIDLQFDPIPAMEFDDSLYHCPGFKFKLKLDSHKSLSHYLNGIAFSGDTSLHGYAKLEIRSENHCGMAIDSVTLFEDYLPKLDYDDTITICKGFRFQSFPPYPNRVDYTLNGVSLKSDPYQTMVLRDTGLYILEGVGNCGSDRDSIYLDWDHPLDVDLGEDRYLFLPLTLELDAGVEADEYWWNTGAKTRKITATDTGVYWVEARNECGTFSDTIALKLYVGLKNLNGQGLKVYPNPADNILLVELQEAGASSYAVLDAAGRMVQSGELSSGTNSLNMAVLPSGVYTLRVKSEKGMSRIKISVMH